MTASSSSSSEDMQNATRSLAARYSDKRTIAHALFKRAVESRVQRYMKQNDVMLLRTHQELCRVRTDAECLKRELDKHKQIIAQQQAEIIRLKDQLSECTTKDDNVEGSLDNILENLPDIDVEFKNIFDDTPLDGLVAEAL